MRRRVLLVANDLVGTSMGGPGIRYWRFAEELSEHFDVTLAVPFETDLDSDRFRLVVASPWSAREMTTLSRSFDAVVAQRLPVPTMLALAASTTRAIYDLYAPLTIENLAFDALEPEKPAKEAYHRLNTLTQATALRSGDAFVCASERQRDLWLGALLTEGRIDHDSYARDRSLRDLLDVVPFGIDPEPPRRGPGPRGGRRTARPPEPPGSPRPGRWERHTIRRSAPVAAIAPTENRRLRIIENVTATRILAEGCHRL